MKETLTEAAVKYIIARLIDKADRAIYDAQKDDNEFNDGRKLAYYEMLDTVKNELIAHDQNLADFGLDINLEHKLS